MMPYRQDYTMDFNRRLQMALDAQRQRSAMTGRPLAPQEVGEITEAAIHPYAQAYGQDYLNAMRLQQQQSNWKKMYNLRQQGLKQAEKAAQVAGVAEFVKLGLGAGNLAGRYYRGRPAATTAPQAQPAPQQPWVYPDEDPQMHGVSPSAIQSYGAEDPYLAQSPQDYWRWAQRGREVMYDPNRGTSMGVWREQEKIDQQYWRKIQAEQQRINFLRTQGL